MRKIKNVIDWFSIPSSDFERAVTFYETILSIDMPRIQMPDGTNMAFFKDDQSDGVGGDINDNLEIKPSDKGTFIFLNADGLDKILSLIETAGGSVIMSKTEVGEWGFIAKFKDSEGNVVGLHSES